MRISNIYAKSRKKYLNFGMGYECHMCLDHI